MQKLPFRSLAGEKSPSRSAPEQKTPRSCDRGVSLVGAGNLLGEQDFEDLDGCRGDRRTGAEDGGGAVAVAHDPLCKALCNGGFANAGLTDQAGVVLGLPTS